MPQPDAGTSGEQDKDKQQKPDAGGSGASGDAGQGSGTGAKDKDGDFQKVIDAIIKRERTEAAQREADLRRQLDELKAGKDGQGDKGTKGKGQQDDEAYAESIRKPLLEELEKERAKNTQRAERVRRSEIKVIADELSVDPDEVAAQLLGRTQLADGDEDRVEVIGADGRVEYGKAGPKTVRELVIEHLAKKPYLAKASVRDGIGVQGVQAKPGTAASEIAAVKEQIAAAEKEKKWGLAGQLKIKLTELQAKK